MASYVCHDEGNRLHFLITDMQCIYPCPSPRVSGGFRSNPRETLSNLLACIAFVQSSINVCAALHRKLLPAHHQVSADLSQAEDELRDAKGNTTLRLTLPGSGFQILRDIQLTEFTF